MEFESYGQQYASITRLADGDCDVCLQNRDDLVFFTWDGFGRGRFAPYICPACLADVLAPVAKRAQKSDARLRPRGARRPIPDKLQWAVMERDQRRCKYRGVSVDDLGPGVSLEIDHIVPVALGGKTEMRNLWTACTLCNRGKGPTVPESVERWISGFFAAMERLDSLIRSRDVTPREMVAYILAMPDPAEQQRFLAMIEEIATFLESLVVAMRERGLVAEPT